MVYDVAIIGCGPVGALAANLAGRAGLNTIVIEREAMPYPLPRAVHLDHEMMRLFQAAGVIGPIAADMRGTEGHLHVGADHGVIRYMGTVGHARPFGWGNDYFFFQPELEEHLRSALAALPTVTLRLGAACTAVNEIEGHEIGGHETDGHVSLGLETADGPAQIEARYVIACDGARSTLRRLLDIKLDDLDFEEPWLVVDAEVDGPISFPPIAGLPAGADLQKLSVMMCDPARPATIVPGRGNHRRWEFMLLPGESDEAMMAPEQVQRLVGPWVRDVPHRIIRAASYRFHGLVAEQWRRGRVFLAGDAAHQTPPFFGQGMCHGMRDVANLVWKLALVTQGQAEPALLDSYQPERDPHVRAVIAAAVAAGRYICMLDPAAARERDLALREAARKASGPTTAADLIPALAAGVIAEGTAGAGQRFIQPWVTAADGRRLLLDEAIGGGWRLLTTAERLAEATAAAATLPALGLTVHAVDHLGDQGTVAGWLDSRGAEAVLIRPDFYVFGTAAGALAPLTERLAATLHLTPTLEAV